MYSGVFKHTLDIYSDNWYCEWCFLLQEGTDGENHIRVGKLNLVDLAGSERQTKTGAQVIIALSWG